MKKFIKYKRIVKEVNSNSINDLFKEIISGGLEIIYYNEKLLKDSKNFTVTIVAGKTQSNIL